MLWSRATTRRSGPRLLWPAVIVMSLTIARPAQAQLPSAMARTWSLFQAALRSNDPDALARLSQFPLQSNEFGGPIGDPARLRAHFSLIFSSPRRRCLLQQTPRQLQVDGRVIFEAFCDNDRYPIRFLFERVGKDYRWTGLDNINE